MPRLFLLAALVLAATPAAAFEVCDAAKDPTAFAPHDRWAVIADQGRDGWVFAKGELLVPADLAHAAGPLQRLAAALKAKGVEPFLVDVPGRLAVAEEMLDPERSAFRDYRRGSIATSYARKIAAVAKTGWTTVDVAGLATSSGLGVGMYLDRDHHWSVEGEKVVVADLTKRIQALPVWGSVPKKAFTLRERAVAYSGTYRYTVVDKCGNEIEATPSFSYKADADQELSAEALLGDEATPEVVLIGTSQSRRQDFDLKANRQVFEDSFAALLRHGLGADVLNLAVEGGGTYTSLEAWLTSEEYQRGSPKVVIWEMNDSDGFEDLSTLRRVVPAAWGQCRTSEALAKGKGDVGQYRPILDVDPALGIKSPQHYLVFKLSDGGITDFSVSFKHGSRTDTVAVKRSKLLPNSGLYFVEVSKQQSPLESVTVELPSGASGTWKARICAAPQ
jgi:alginate biosynthesis protein AlgX